MFVLQILVVVFIIGFLFGRSNTKQYVTKYYELKRKLESELQASKNKQVREVLSRTLGIQVPSQYTDNHVEDSTHNKNVIAEPWQPEPPTENIQTTPLVYEEKTAQSVVGISEPHNDFAIKNYVDNTSLLLYFGAFLFITSVGLFVAFGDVEGVQRTALVALVALLMYGSGFYLWNTKKKLQQVGEAFIGIGMMAIPFVGITAYNNNSTGSNAASIWLVTSIVALLMYAATIIYLRTTFVSYLLIGSLVSLSQSFVGITESPVYYFIWMLAITGILMQFLSLFSRTITPLRDASSSSGQIFIPIALFASVFASTTQGIGQLAMTTGLATLYYGLLAITDRLNRQSYLGLTHVLAIVTTLLTVYAMTESFSVLASTLIALSIIHALAIFVFKRYLQSDITHQNIMLITAMFIVIFSIIEYEPVTIVFGVMTFFVLSSLIAFVYRYMYSLLFSLGSWIALSYAVGQLLPSQRLESIEQAILSTIFVIPFIIILAFKKFGPDQLWQQAVNNFFLAGLIIALGVSLSSTPYEILFMSLWLFAIATTANELSKISDNSCRYVSLLFAGTPLLYAVLAQTHLNEPGYFTIATLLLLVITILQALRYKFEFARWLSTISWLLLPIALTADKVMGLTWTSAHVLWLYSIVVLVLSISRAIARGKILPNYNVPLASLAKSSSQSYLIGMLTAAGIVYVASFGTSGYSSVVPALYIVVLTIYLTWHFKTVEKSNYFAGILPLFAQLALLRLIEPYSETSKLLEIDKAVLFPLLSSAIATCFYFLYATQTKNDEKYDSSLTKKDFYTVAILTLFIAPASFIFTGEVSWAMPATLMIAGGILLSYNWHNTQSNKEIIGALIFFGLLWLLNYFGIDNIQIYTHLLAALFALYAYIRHTLKDTAITDQYLLAMLATSTVPLILQSLGSDSGESLGLWLLLEQTGFFLLGIAIRKPFVTKWGLYVAIGAVLYQLRDLGWAMLAVLSLFIIGIAIYRALKQPDDK
jgi:hypothetical protein